MSVRRVLPTAICALILSGGLGASVGLAGGWAVTTIDPLPEPPRAGEATSIGYTIRQHGVTPVELAGTGIELLSSEQSQSLFFPGRPDGPKGHYTAKVTIPAAGTWSWRARQGSLFAPQELGTIGVQGEEASPSPGAGDSSGPGTVGWLLLAATLASAAGLVALVTLGRRRAEGPSAAS